MTNQLYAEIRMLRKNLEAKAPLVQSEQGKSSPLSWKDKVASDLSSARMSLQYYPPCVLNDKLVVNPPVEIEISGVSKWKDCVVGYFVDKKLPFMAVKKIAEKIWGKFGLSEVLSKDEDFFIFQFDRAGAYRQIVEAGPWHFGGRLLVLKQWQPHMTLEKEQLKKVPLWAQFYNVPLEMWTEQGLSYVASAVGNPLYADQLTESCKRLSYAKICVEVDVDSILPESFELSLSNGSKFNIKVWYPWRPLKCEKCMVFGHKT